MSKRDDEDDLVEFVHKGAHKVGQAVDVPTPLGRNMAGWVPVQYKLQPEAMIMLEQLREHHAFRGKWKTQAQVAWAMTFLGLQSMVNFLNEDWHGWRKFKSNWVVMNNAAAEHARLQREEVLQKSASLYKRTILGWLNKEDEHGKYMAWKTLESALNAREVCEDVKRFDEAMRTPERGVALGSSLVFDNRACELYERVVPKAGGEVDDGGRTALYEELTADYFHQLDSAQGGDPEE